MTQLFSSPLDDGRADTLLVSRGMVVPYAALRLQALNEAGATSRKMHINSSVQRENLAVLSAGGLLWCFLCMFEGDMFEMIGGE